MQGGIGLPRFDAGTARIVSENSRVNIIRDLFPVAGKRSLIAKPVVLDGYVPRSWSTWY
jgi:hypothetical protein